MIIDKVISNNVYICDPLYENHAYNAKIEF